MREWARFCRISKYANEQNIVRQPKQNPTIQDPCSLARLFGVFTGFCSEFFIYKTPCACAACLLNRQVSYRAACTVAAPCAAVAYLLPTSDNVTDQRLDTLPAFAWVDSYPKLMRDMCGFGAQNVFGPNSPFFKCPVDSSISRGSQRPLTLDDKHKMRAPDLSRSLQH